MIISEFGFDLIKIKAELLCWGCRIGPDSCDIVLSRYPLLLDEKHLHSAHLVLERNIVVNVCFGEEFSGRSPYQILLSEGSYFLYRDNIKVSHCYIVPEPKWYRKLTSHGIEMMCILRLHGLSVLADATFSRCDFISTGEGCLFCSFPCERIDEDSKIMQLGETVAAAIAENPECSVVLSEGARADSEAGMKYFAMAISQIRGVAPKAAISVEMVPPEPLYLMDIVINAGATNLIMNLEISDDNLRAIFCPGKARISAKKYADAWRWGLERLGPGSVSSVLIAGIERDDLTINAALKMIDIGVMPTIIPFRPYDRCLLKNMGETNPEMLIRIEDIIGRRLNEAGLRFNQGGCASCGACSLEKDYSN